MKRFILVIICLFFIENTFAQIANFNNFPTMKPSHILDENLTNISFAFSMRVIVSDYEGSLIRLRRASDNTTKDFGWADNDVVDIAAINAWRGTSLVYVNIWYDQSGLGRNAIQNTTTKQPSFYPDDPLFPYFQGDGTDDCLTVSGGGIQIVTTSGSQGTVITTMKATSGQQHSFGVLTNSDRWSVHVNWIDGNLYFDPGICCNSPRSFNNAAKANAWEIYSFIKASSTVTARSGGVQRFSGTHTTGRCTRTEEFAIGWATGNGTTSYATTGFNEFIMYKTDINTTQIQEIETNSQTFWGI